LLYAIRRIQANQKGLKLNALQLVVYADVNILGRSIHTVKKNTEALVASKKIGQVVKDEKT
jgi:cell division FtsZ-interacting protein ZapD